VFFPVGIIFQIELSIIIIFNVVNLPTNYSIDGGIVCNNSCEIGLDEAFALWPEKSVGSVSINLIFV
jgi:hypothetical protein